MAYYKSKVTGLSYHYEIQKSYLPFDVAYIHGNLASRRWWYPLHEQLKSKGLPNSQGRAFLLEFLGAGLSEAPRGLEDVSMVSFAQEFNEILKENQFTQGGVVGHSTGGLIAALMMSEAPDLFRGGFALDPVGARGVQFDESMTHAFEAMKMDEKLTATVIASTIKDIDLTESFFKDTIVPDAYLGVKQVGDKVLRALSRLNVEEQIKKIRSPLWVIHGEKDFLLPQKDSEQLAALAPQGVFFQEPNAGHCLNYENPSRLADLLIEWSQKI